MSGARRGSPGSRENRGMQAARITHRGAVEADLRWDRIIDPFSFGLNTEMARRLLRRDA